MNQQQTEPCERKDAPGNPCKTCTHACPLGNAMASHPADWKIWALMAVGVVAAAVIIKLVLYLL